MKTYYILTLGCQMNKSDSTRIAAVLSGCGLKSASTWKTADLLVINACSVRQSAIDRVFGKAKYFKKMKQEKELVTVLTGCVLVSDKSKLGKSFDYVVDIKDIINLPKILGLNKSQVDLKDYLEVIPEYNSDFQAFVPIMNGCNNFCAYCVVPYTRGREVSRPVEEIIKEVKILIDKGFKEITLLGQNVNSYQAVDQAGRKINFPELLKMIDELKGEFWLKFLTSHPKDMSDELIEVMARGKKISHYLSLPVQSGDDLVLKNMNRHYTVAHYKDLVRKIRAKIPDVMLTTDIIVGFPGETKEQFDNTARLFKDIQFDMAYLAQYSPRAQTKSALLKDDVSKEEKKRRERYLNEILKEIALNCNKKLVSQTVEVLVESFDNSHLQPANYGHSKNGKLVKIESKESFVGQVIKVKLIKAGSWGFLGKII